jgi:hypothetical protein
MTRPQYVEKCKNCFARFIPSVEVESLPVFNSADKSRWKETTCPKCGIRYQIARLSKNSLDVCIILSESLPPRESEIIQRATQTIVPDISGNQRVSMTNWSY